MSAFDRKIWRGRCFRICPRNQGQGVRFRNHHLTHWRGEVLLWRGGAFLGMLGCWFSSCATSTRDPAAAPCRIFLVTHSRKAGRSRKVGTSQSYPPVRTLGQPHGVLAARDFSDAITARARLPPSEATHSHRVTLADLSHAVTNPGILFLPGCTSVNRSGSFAGCGEPRPF